MRLQNLSLDEALVPSSYKVITAKVIQKNERLSEVKMGTSFCEKEVGRRRAHSKDDRAKRVRVTRRGGREASERRNGIGEGVRHQEMAQPVAQ